MLFRLRHLKSIGGRERTIINEERHGFLQWRWCTLHQLLVHATSRPLSVSHSLRLRTPTRISWFSFEIFQSLSPRNLQNVLQWALVIHYEITKHREVDYYSTPSNKRFFSQFYIRVLLLSLLKMEYLEHLKPKNCFNPKEEKHGNKENIVYRNCFQSFKFSISCSQKRSSRQFS